MEQEQIASIKEQVFGQSPTQSPQPTNDVPPADTPPVDTPTSDLPPTDTPPIDTPPADTPTTEIVDANEYLKTNLGYDSWETAKAELAELKALKETAPKPIEYANEESKKVHELLLAGKVKEVKAIYDLQEKLEGVDALKAEDAIKLHIEQTNKHYKKADVEDVFEEKYTYPEKPEQGEFDATETDDAFAIREEKYKNAVEKINRRIERDAVTAKEELSKLKQEIKLPELPNTPNPELEEFTAYKQNQNAAEETHKFLVETVSKLSEKDVSYNLSFNDEAKKVKVDVSYLADKEGVDKAKAAATNYADFLQKTYYNEDGSPLGDKLTKDIYLIQNWEKLMTEGIKQAVNETMLQIARNQKNIGDGFQRNFNVVQPSEIEKLKEQVFAKTG